MSGQLNILLLCGGQSTEHEISLLSCKNVLSGFDTSKYRPQVVYIAQYGTWYLLDDAQDLLEHEPQQLISQAKAQPVCLLPGDAKHPLALRDQPTLKVAVDCVFPVLHGSNGEDGTMQGLLEILDVPYVGCNTLSSALCMEKHISKRLMRSADLPTADWVTLHEDTELPSYKELAGHLGNDMIVKPVSLGSSVGAHKVRNNDDYIKAIQDAFQYDDRVLVESFIDGRELECSVIGNEEPVSSLPGEFVLDKTRYDIYSYEAKYLDSTSMRIVTPAQLDDATAQRFQDMAVAAYRALYCQGMARVDFFLTHDNKIFINELNPIPGFTSISLYPKNWEVSGIELPELLDDLIGLAMARHRRDNTYSRVHVSQAEISAQADVLPRAQSSRS